FRSTHLRMATTSRGASGRRFVLNAHSRRAVRTAAGANWAGFARSSAMVVAVRVLAMFLRLLPPSWDQRASTYSTANLYPRMAAALERLDTGRPVVPTNAPPLAVARMSSERMPSVRAIVSKGSRQRFIASRQRTVYVFFRATLYARIL